MYRFEGAAPKTEGQNTMARRRGPRRPFQRSECARKTAIGDVVMIVLLTVCNACSILTWACAQSEWLTRIFFGRKRPQISQRPQLEAPERTNSQHASGLFSCIPSGQSQRRQWSVRWQKRRLSFDRLDPAIAPATYSENGHNDVLFGVIVGPHYTTSLSRDNGE